MKNRLSSVALRRIKILEKIETQRIELSEISMQWQKPLALADTGLKAVRFVRNHPAWVAGGVSALVAMRRKGLVGFALEGWRLLYLYPSTLAFGLKYLSSVFSSRGKEIDGKDVGTR